VVVLVPLRNCSEEEEVINLSKTNKPPEYYISVVLPRREKREVTSIRISSDLWKKFKQAAKGDGLTMCDLLEGFMKAYLAAREAKLSGKVSAVPIVTVLVHEVRKVRRK